MLIFDKALLYTSTDSFRKRRNGYSYRLECVISSYRIILFEALFVLFLFQAWFFILRKFRLKASVLERIHQEPEKKIKTVIIQAAGQIALMEPDHWPELFRLIDISCEGGPEMKEVSHYENCITIYQLYQVCCVDSFLISVGLVRH